MIANLHQPVESVKFIGDSYGQRLHRLGIFTANDLVHHYPIRYEDLRQTSPLDSIKVGEKVVLRGHIVGITSRRLRTGKTLQNAIFTDGTSTLNVTWFNQPYLEKVFQHQPQVNLSGKVTEFRGNPVLSAPEFEIINPDLDQTLVHSDRLVPIYPLTEGISNKWLRSRLNALTNQDGLNDYLPDTIVNKHRLLNYHEALRQIHFPKDQNTLKQAITRLKFNELFLYQLAAQSLKTEWDAKEQGLALAIDPDSLHQFLLTFPFSLTKAQSRCIKEITQDLTHTKPMHRLLQGDVGSGKTAVAIAAAYVVSKVNHFKTIIMAPTEILALQHAKTFAALLKNTGLNISVQTASKKDPLDKADIIIGTHALLYRPMPAKVGLVIIDEQHRFGVEQRSQLAQVKPTPHLLSLTATPIPRTIALTLYAQLDISSIDEMPPGRKIVKTWAIPEKKRDRAYHWIDERIKEHDDQVFVVCPLIESSDTHLLDGVKAAEAEYLKLTQLFPNRRLGLVHGRMTAKAKNDAISLFKDGSIDILVATPVIEVGIDIPKASVMLIESAERFGLASLHQLRGRIGRSERDSFCLLLTTPGIPITKRLKYLESVHQGLKLAELDLKLRGPGNIFGLQQSGYVNLRIASFNDIDLINLTHTEAKNLLNQAPELTPYPALAREVSLLLEKIKSGD
jgi:ATP-dependent DNA helicase RecG